jgi:hypothetical protein
MPAINNAIDKEPAVQANPAERRSCVRYSFQAPIVCGRFNSERTFQGAMRNYGASGLFVESPIAIKSGTPVFIRVAGWPLKADVPPSELCRSASLGEVRWCRPFGDPENPRYGIGIKFYPL